jgi:hypothetical protein
MRDLAEDGTNWFLLTLARGLSPASNPNVAATHAATARSEPQPSAISRTRTLAPSEQGRGPFLNVIADLQNPCAAPYSASSADSMMSYLNAMKRDSMM